VLLCSDSVCAEYEEKKTRYGGIIAYLADQREGESAVVQQNARSG
jgi:hypothetical protein